MSSSLTPTPQNVEELQAMVRERLEQRQAERRKDERSLPSAPLLWMTLVREWTEPLLTFVARHLLGSEWNDHRIGEVVDLLTDRDWLHRTAAPALRGRSTPTIIQLAPKVAERQLERQLAHAREPLDFWANLAALAMALEESRQELERQFLPTSTRRWASLAAASVEEDHSVLKSLTNRLRLRSWQPTGEFLEQQVEGAIAASDPARAQRWLEAAQPLASVLSRTLDTTLDVTLRRAALRLELYHRRRHDLKHLEHFLERDDQLHALEKLIRRNAKDPNAPWALHLLGGGGVGKTMLVRHLTARLADSEHWGLSIGRVDFDFLNPDYPRRSPGLLLWAFALELRVFDSSGKVGQIFEDGDRVLRQLHDQLHAGEGSGELLDHPLLIEGLDIYGQALELLPQPVVFVIDTCEELTKPRAGTDGHFNVEATFQILERLHSYLPSLRVIFAGRRPLAEAGSGWTCPSCSLPPRPFLQLFEMRGFSTAEAKTYLKRREVPSHLVEAVVQRSSPDSGGAAGIQWFEGQGPEDITRCNPYELNFYAEWALDDPPPSPEDIERAGGNRYVELRILRRLGHGTLEALLPLLGLARHVDEDLLQAVSGLEGDTLEDLLRELEHQEWVELRTTTSAEAPRRIFSMEEGLRLRLLSYCRDQAGQLEVQRQLAADVLRRRILEDDPAELDGTDLDAALRVMESEPDADLWWRHVESRLFAERDADWVGQQASYLVGPEGAAALPDDASWPELRTVHPLRPAVMATLALAESRTPGGGLTPWMEVAETAESLPNICDDLALRARAMVLAAQHANGFDLVPGDAWDLWLHMASLSGVPTPETVAALVAAAEATVEHYEEHRRTPGTEKLLRLDDESESSPWATAELRRHFTRWSAEADPPWKDASWARQLEAMLQALDGRVVARLGDRPEAATERFREARRLAAGLDQSRPLQAWSPPAYFFSRLKLEAMRALYPRVLSAAECLQEFGARAPAEGVDWDRFLSQLAEVALALGPKEQIFQELATKTADDPVHTMHCRAHFEVPPFAISRAQLLAASGDVDQGMQALRDIIRNAASLDTTVVQHAARAQLDLGIRFRFLDDAPGFSLADSPYPDDHDLLSLADTLGYPPMKRKPFSVQDTRRAMHGHWRTLTSPAEEDCRAAFETGQDRWETVEAQRDDFDVLDAHLILDGWEASYLSKTYGKSDTEKAAVAFLEANPWLDKNFPVSRYAKDRWRLHLRQNALSLWQARITPSPEVPLQLDDLEVTLADRLGRRRAALLAWREADLLALRLPAAAAHLFRVARRLFQDVEDPWSEAICMTAKYHCLMSITEPGIQQPTRLGLNNLKTCWRRLGNALDDDPSAVAPHLRRWWYRARWLLQKEPRTKQISTPISSAQWTQLGYREPMLTWLEDPQVPVQEKTSTPPSPSFSLGQPLEDGSFSKEMEPPHDVSPTDDEADGEYSVECSDGPKGDRRMAPPPSPPLGPTLSATNQAPGELQLQIDSRVLDSGGFEVQIQPGQPSLETVFLQINKLHTPYGQGVKSLAGTDLASLALRPGQAVALLIDQQPELAWEGILSTRESVEALQFRRVAVFPQSTEKVISISEPRWPASSPSPGVRTVALISESTTAEDQIGRIWHYEYSFVFQAIHPEALFSQSKKSQPEEPVVHVIGTPIETSAGYRWRFQMRKGEVIDLRAGDLQQFFPKLTVLILQETPVPEMHPRSDADRRQASYLRAIAAEAQQAGIPAVLTVPHLLPRTAARCIEEIARLFVLSSPWGMKDVRLEDVPSLLDTVDAIRHHIRQDDSVDDEAAWDVVLYSPPGWRNPFLKTNDSTTPLISQDPQGAPHMSFMQGLKNFLGKDQVKRSVLTFDDASGDSGWILPEVHYMRVRLVEMFITKRTWLGKTWYPALHGLVKATYGSGDIELPSVADTSKLFQEQAGTGDVVARNFYLTPLLPYRGNRVEILCGLFAMEGEDVLGKVLKTLSDFSGLLAVPQLSQALNIATPLASGLQNLLGAVDGRMHLGYHDAWVSVGNPQHPADNGLRRGYVAVLRAAPDDLDTSTLKVEGQQLCQVVDGVTEPYTGCDHMLLHIESRTERDDLARLTSFWQPYKDSLDALALDESDKARALIRQALMKARTSDDLTNADRNRVSRYIRSLFEEAKEDASYLGAVPMGVGATRGGPPRGRDIRGDVPDEEFHLPGSAVAARDAGVPTLDELWEGL